MFDPYDKWLRISDEERPVTHYQLLDIDPEEDDPDVIVAAAKKQKSRVIAHQDGPNAKAVDRLVKEINQAKATLLDKAKRREYDKGLANANGKNGKHAFEGFEDEEDDAPGQRKKQKKGASRSGNKANPPWLWPVMGVAALLIVGGIVTAVVLTRNKKADDSPKKEVAQVKEEEPAPAPVPKKEEKPAPKPEKPPEVKPAVPAVVAPPQPQPQPAPPPPPPPPPAKFVKMKVPDSAAQTKATATIQAAYKADYAKTKPEDKLNLAAKFLQPGRENRKDPAEWFVMLREARDLSVQAGRPRLAVEAV
ncbi:MAG TPA: hypothetical protein VGZ25_03825, partial [Gemmataceae bacterium]|nr:hypothetical protein [Gemmataceae bacterium]